MLRVLLLSLLLFSCSKDHPAPTASAGKSLATTEAPKAPTNLRVEALTDTSARVAWDAVEGATDYDLNYRTIEGRWTNEPHKGTRLYNTIHNLEPNTEYRWAVRAENRDGPSKWTFAKNFITLVPEPETELIPPTPENPTISEISTPPQISTTIQPEPFNIDIVFSDTFHEHFSNEQIERIKHGVRRVENVLTDIPDYQRSTQYTSCLGDPVIIPSQVDDIMIYFKKIRDTMSSYLDGGALPMGLRSRYSPNRFELSLGGCVELNPRLQGEELSMVTAHEIIHSLGFGTKFYSPPEYGGLESILVIMRNPPMLENTDFVGTQALEVYHAAGGKGDIPLDIGHWKRNTITYRTLMNPYGSPTDPFEITTLDVAALADMGYPVRIENANPLVPHGSAGKITFDRGPLDHHDH